jgi:hypothetical protein
MNEDLLSHRSHGYRCDFIDRIALTPTCPGVTDGMLAHASHSAPRKPSPTRRQWREVEFRTVVDRYVLDKRKLERTPQSFVQQATA